MSDSDKCVRQAAVDRLSDQRLLSQVAVSDSDEFIRASALNRVDDSALIARRAREDPSRFVRASAVWRITDQSLLRSVASNDRDDSVRLEAALRLQDSDIATRVLGEVAESAGGAVQLGALGSGRLEQDVVASIAQGDESPIVREVAVGLLEDAGLLSHIAEVDPSEKVRKVARFQRAARLLAIDCQSGLDSACQALASDARGHTETDDQRLRSRAAIRCLTDGAVLAEVARSGDVREREFAVENPNFRNPAVLAQIAMDEQEDYYVREAAIRKLEDRNLLASLAAESPSTLQRAASDRLVSIAAD